MFGYISILLDFLLTKVNHLAKNRPMHYNIHTDLNRVLHYDEHKLLWSCSIEDLGEKKIVVAKLK